MLHVAAGACLQLSMPLAARARDVSCEIHMPTLPSGQCLELREDANIYDSSYDLLADAISVGGSLWPSAAMLCRYLRDMPNIRGSSVMELGSGTGACGIYSAALGASRVLLTDGSSALQTLQLANVGANEHLFDKSTLVSTAHYLWGQSLPDGAANFDFVIGSDLSELVTHRSNALRFKPPALLLGCPLTPCLSC